MKCEEILEECKDLIDKVCIKYGYNDKDEVGNESLKTVLLKVVPAMLKDAKEVERKLFYKMLSHTPIVLVDNLTKETYSKLIEKILGKEIYEYIVEQDEELGEYGKGPMGGVYVSGPVLDENMQLQAKKSFICVQRDSGKQKKALGTDINISMLIHELGHAWYAEKDEYVINEDGTLKQRVGTSEMIYSLSKTKDNKWIPKCIKTTGTMIEEVMNVIEEEKAMATYLGVSLEEISNIYAELEIENIYQADMTNVGKHMIKKLGRIGLEKFRMHGNEEEKRETNAMLSKTDFWQNRETDILFFMDTKRSYSKKTEIIRRIGRKNVQDFFDKYEELFFPDISEMTPVEKIDNALNQMLTLRSIKRYMGKENYHAFMERIYYECYPLINQAAALKANQELTHLVSGVKKSELEDITGETRSLLEHKKDKGENVNARN